MLLERAHPKLLQAALLTAAVTPERQTAAAGISASSSDAISWQLWSCLKLKRGNPSLPFLTAGHQMDKDLAFATGRSLATPAWKLIMFDCVCQQKEGNIRVS